MLKQILEKLKTLGETSRFDPSAFNDTIASLTEWTPRKGGGSNFKTHQLTKLDADRMEFRASLGAKLFYLIFLLAGLGMVVFVLSSVVSKGRFALETQTLMPMGMGVVFAIVGGVLFYFGTAPIVFNKLKGCYWKGRKCPDEVIHKEELKNYTGLDQIHAIQLISEYCRGNKSSYYSYELNLVLNDGSRLNVIDHGNKEKIRDDAEKLGEFLGVPVWDAIGR